jgi:hypothetical protein
VTELVLRVGASKLALSVVIALVAWVIERWWNRPVAAHTLWLLVPCVMLIPAVFALPVAGLPGYESIGRLAGAGVAGPRSVEVLLGSASGAAAAWVERG